MRLPKQGELIGIEKIIDVCTLSDIVAGLGWLRRLKQQLDGGWCLEWSVSIDDDGCRACIGAHQGRCSPYELLHGGMSTLPVREDGLPAEEECPLREGFLLLTRGE